MPIKRQRNIKALYRASSVTHCHTSDTYKGVADWFKNFHLRNCTQMVHWSFLVEQTLLRSKLSTSLRGCLCVPSHQLPSLPLADQLLVRNRTKGGRFQEWSGRVREISPPRATLPCHMSSIHQIHQVILDSFWHSFSAPQKSLLFTGL